MVIEKFVRERIADMRGGIWENLASTSVDRDEWGKMANTIIMFLRDVFALGPRVAFVCHEREREIPDTNTTSRCPDLSPKLLSSVYRMSDAIVRLGKTNQPVTFGNDSVKAGERILRLKDSPHYLAKWREPDGSPIPELVGNPTWKKLSGLTKGNPRRILIYGPPGVGKTTFICSEKG